MRTYNSKISKKFTSVLTLVAFLISQVILPSQALAIGEVAATSIQIAPEMGLTLSPDLGTIEKFHSGSGPVLVHIQTAHGNYEAQKKIQALLHELKDKHGIKTLFIEGGAYKLQPEYFRLFPNDMELTMAVADEMAKEALIKGTELFLIEEADAEGYGIENLETYLANGEAFETVLREQKKTENFIRNMDMQIERLTSPFLNKDLRAFVKRLEDFEMKRLPFLDWLSYLKGEAQKNLDVDLKDRAYQLRYPQLTRVFALQQYEKDLNLGAYAREKRPFLKKIKKDLPQDIYSPIENLLNNPVSRHQLPDPETTLLFEAMVRELPEDFDYAAYPNVKIFIAHLILQSEIHASELMAEVHGITDEITGQLAKTQEEKKVVSLLKDHRLLQRLFALELTPMEYDQILERGDSIQPKNVISRFLELNESGRVRDAKFSNVSDITSLYNSAMSFYRLVKERDEYMMRNIVSKMGTLGIQKAAVVTGGFHSGPFGEFFEKQDFRYALVAPKITTADGREAYLESVLQNEKGLFTQATWETSPSCCYDGAAVNDHLSADRRQAKRRFWAGKAVQNTFKAAAKLDRPLESVVEQLRETLFAGRDGIVPGFDGAQGGKPDVVLALFPIANGITEEEEAYSLPTRTQRRVTTTEILSVDFENAREVQFSQAASESRSKVNLLPFLYGVQSPELQAKYDSLVQSQGEESFKTFSFLSDRPGFDVKFGREGVSLLIEGAFSDRITDISEDGGGGVIFDFTDNAQLLQAQEDVHFVRADLISGFVFIPGSELDSQTATLRLTLRDNAAYFEFLEIVRPSDTAGAEKSPMGLLGAEVEINEEDNSFRILGNQINIDVVLRSEVRGVDIDRDAVARGEARIATVDVTSEDQDAQLRPEDESLSTEDRRARTESRPPVAPTDPESPEGFTPESPQAPPTGRGGAGSLFGVRPETFTGASTGASSGPEGTDSGRKFLSANRLLPLDSIVGIQVISEDEKVIGRVETPTENLTLKAKTVTSVTGDLTNALIPVSIQEALGAVNAGDDVTVQVVLAELVDGSSIFVGVLIEPKLLDREERQRTLIPVDAAETFLYRLTEPASVDQDVPFPALPIQVFSDGDVTQIPLPEVPARTESRASLEEQTFENAVAFSRSGDAKVRSLGIQLLSLQTSQSEKATRSLTNLAKFIRADDEIVAALVRLNDVQTLITIVGEAGQSAGAKVNALAALKSIGADAGSQAQLVINRLVASASNIAVRIAAIEAVGAIGLTENLEINQAVANNLLKLFRGDLVFSQAVAALPPFGELISSSEVAEELLAFANRTTAPGEIANVAAALGSLKAEDAGELIGGEIGEIDADRLDLITNRNRAALLALANPELATRSGVDSEQIRTLASRGNLDALTALQGFGASPESIRVLTRALNNEQTRPAALRTLAAFGADATEAVRDIVATNPKGQTLGDEEAATLRALGPKVVPVVLSLIQGQNPPVLLLFEILLLFSAEDLEPFRENITQALTPLFRTATFRGRSKSREKAVELLTRLSEGDALILLASLDTELSPTQFPQKTLELIGEFDPEALARIKPESILRVFNINTLLYTEIRSLILKLPIETLLPVLAADLKETSLAALARRNAVITAIGELKGADQERERILGDLLALNPKGQIRDLAIAALEQVIASRSESRTQFVPENVQFAVLFTLFAQLHRQQQLREQQAQRLIEAILGISIAYALVADVSYAEVQSQIGTAPFALTPEFQGVIPNLQIPNAQPDEVVETGFGTQLIEKEFLDIQAQNPAALKDQLLEFRSQRLQSDSEAPVAVVYVEAGQSDAYRNRLVQKLSHAEAELPVLEDRVNLVAELQIVELAPAQTEAEAMQATAADKNGAVIVLGVGTSEIPGLYKFGFEAKELRRAHRSLVGVMRYVTAVAGRAAKIAEGKDAPSQVKAERISKLVALMLAGADRKGNVFFFAKVAELALQAAAARYVESRA